MRVFTPHHAGTTCKNTGNNGLSIVSPFDEKWESSVRAWLGLFESEQLRELGVEHPRRKKSGQSPVLKALRNTRVAYLRFPRAECHTYQCAVQSSVRCRTLTIIRRVKVPRVDHGS